MSKKDKLEMDPELAATAVIQLAQNSVDTFVKYINQELSDKQKRQITKECVLAHLALFNFNIATVEDERVEEFLYNVMGFLKVTLEDDLSIDVGNDEVDVVNRYYVDRIMDKEAKRWSDHPMFKTKDGEVSTLMGLGVQLNYRLHRALGLAGQDKEGLLNKAALVTNMALIDSFRAAQEAVWDRASLTI